MYAIVEMQTNGNTMIVSPVITKETRDEAEQAFHQVASFAAVSNVELHTVVMLNAQGERMKKETYSHKADE